jgi:membrane protein required for colicin V production
MKILDILILIPLLYGAYNGFKRGLLLEIIAVVASVAGFLFGLRFLGWGLNFLKPYLGDSQFLPYLGFAMVFFPVVLLINRLGWMLRKSLRYSLLGNFDSMAGAIVGIFSWGLGVSTFLMLANYVKAIPPAAKKDTVVYPVVLPLAPTVMSKVSKILPMGGDVVQYVKKAVQNYNKDQSPKQNLTP